MTKGPDIPLSCATERVPDALKSERQLSHDEVSLEMQHAKAQRLEPRIAASIRTEPSSVIRPIDLDNERHAGLLRAAEWPGAAPWSAGCVTGARLAEHAPPAPGAERARRAKPGYFVARRALDFAARARFVAPRPGRRIAVDVLADGAAGLAVARGTPKRDTPRQSPPIARSPREACSGVARPRGRAQFWGRPRARRQRRASLALGRRATEDARVPATSASRHARGNLYLRSLAPSASARA